MGDSQLIARLRDWFHPVEELSTRREVLSFLLILSETMIVYIFAGSFLAEFEFPHSPLPVLLIFGLLLIGRLIPYLLSVIRIWSPQYEIIMAASVTVSMLIVINVGAFPETPILSLDWITGARDALILRESAAQRSVWLLIAFVAFIWWRGKTRAEANLETAYSMLRLGLIWMAGALVFTVLISPEGAVILGHVNAALFGFVVFTLLAIAIARQPEGEDAAAWRASWIWLLIFAVPILLIAGTSVSTVGILTRDTLDVALSVLSPVFWLIRVALQAIVLTIAILAFILISPILWLLEQRGIRPLENFPSIDLTPGGISEAQESASTALEIENPVRYLIVGLILLTVIWLLIRFSFRRRRRWEESGRLQRESLIEWDSPARSLLNQVRRWIEASLRPAQWTIGPAGPEWAATRRIRQTYQQFLRSNREQNAPRNPGETPTQYAHRLEVQEAGDPDAIWRITRHYNQARYSGSPATPAEADVVEDAWRTLQGQDRDHPE